MNMAIGLLVVIVLGTFVLKLRERRAKRQAQRQARADKRARIDLADARALQRALDARR